MNEDLERLRQAFPGMVWTEQSGDGRSRHYSTAAGGRWRIRVSAALDAYAMTGHPRRPLGSDPIADLGRVITAEGERITKEAAALATTGALLRFAAVGVPF